MKADMEAKRQELIAKYDTDGDGVLNAAERAAAHAAMQAAKLEELKAKFVALDTDASGGLSLAEFTAGAPTGATEAQILQRFTAMDANKDSALSVDEFTTKPKRPIPQQLKDKFATLDADTSGALSLTEFTAGAPRGATAAQIQAAFTRADKNGDAAVTLEEFAAAAPPPPRRK